jgi:hypothetical protein
MSRRPVSVCAAACAGMTQRIAASRMQMTMRHSQSIPTFSKGASPPRWDPFEFRFSGFDFLENLPPLALLYRDTPDRKPIRELDQAEHKHSCEPVQYAQLRLLVRYFPPGTASASVTISFFGIHDSPAFVALFRHQPDYRHFKLTSRP